MKIIVKSIKGKNLSFDEVISFVETSSHICRKRILINDLKASWEKRDRLRLSGEIPASFLVNLGVNNECFSGKGGTELARFLTSKGIQASLYNHSINEDWVIVFDPEAICSNTAFSAKDIDWNNDQLPTIKEQLNAAIGSTYKM